MAAQWKFVAIFAVLVLHAWSSASILDRPQLAPRFWVPCNVTEQPEPTCADCQTRLVCTQLGGFLIPCLWPGPTHCTDGVCSHEPSEQCAPTTELPPPEPTPPETTTIQTE